MRSGNVYIQFINNLIHKTFFYFEHIGIDNRRGPCSMRCTYIELKPSLIINDPN